MTADLSALIARLEAAEFGGFGFDSEVFIALNLTRPRLDGLASTTHPPVTTSLDAALALAERLGLDVWHIMYAALMNWKAHDPRGPAPKIMPLALCIAILRAKQGEEE